MSEDRPLTTEERFLVELKALRTQPDAHPARPMVARFRRQRDTGGLAATDFSTGTLIKVTEAVRVFLWSPDAEAGTKPELIAQMRCEPDHGWASLPEPAAVMVRGRAEKGAALVIDAEGCTLTSLHPASTRWWRSPRR
ncbi:MAG: hypothetical protein AAGA99_00015 [Actinomycetota bacterium]